MLETDRLILRPFQERDCADVYEYTNLQTVHCFADMHLESAETAMQEVLRRQTPISISQFASSRPAG